MRTGIVGLLGGILALTCGAVSPASAEFFNCHQKPGQVLYSYNGSPSDYGSRRSGYSSRYSRSDYYPQSSRRNYQSHATYSGSRRYWDDRWR
jgi:hypothetical protein